MKICRGFTARALFALVTATVGAQAFPIDKLAASADAIVAASVTGVDIGSDQVVYTLNIVRTFKGSLQPSTITLTQSRAGLKIAGVPLGTTGIWFLKQASSGTWDALVSRPFGAHRSQELFLPAGAATPTGPFAYGPTTSMVDALVYEVAAGIQSTPDDPEVLRGAVDQMNSPAVTAVSLAYMASADPGIKAVGLAVSLQNGLPGAIQQLAQSWGQISSDWHAFDVINVLRGSWRDSTPAAATQLASFAGTAPVASPIRAAAIRALAALHTRDTLPFLASLLSSSSSSEQEQAIYGMSAFANGCPVQTRANTTSMAYLTQCDHSSTYSTADTWAHFAFGSGSSDRNSAYLQFWQGWWSNHSELH